MKPVSRHAVLALLTVGGAAVACSDMGPSAPRMAMPAAPVAFLFSRIKATDSAMMVTSVAYSDTSLMLTRLAPLAADISASAVIGPKGGTIALAAAGATIDFPAGAVAAPTLITMTAHAGPNVVYDFQPHGLTFARPVKIQQMIAGTAAAADPNLLAGMHGSYYGSSLESAWIDAGHHLVRIKEHQLGYADGTGSWIKFFVGHFSGYMLSSGRTNQDAAPANPPGTAPAATPGSTPTPPSDGL